MAAIRSGARPLRNQIVRAPPHSVAYASCVQSDSADVVEQRLEALLLERIAVGSIAMAGSMGVLTAAGAISGQWYVALASAAAQAGAAGAWWGIRRGKIAAPFSGVLSFALWLLAWGAVLVAFVAFHNMTAEIWLALLVWAYGAMQVKRHWAAATFAVGVVSWTAAVLALRVESPILHFVSIAAATGVGALSFGANRAVVRHVEQLRARDVAQRAELAKALSNVEKELAERKAAEQERERLRGQFIAAQRLEAIGVLAGGIAHDMNNVLAAILGIATIRRDHAQGTEAADLDIVISSAERGASLTRSLLGFSRKVQYAKANLALSDVASEVVALLERTAPKGIELRSAVDDSVWVDGDRAYLVQALLNICLNSVHALQGAGHIEIGVRGLELDADQAGPRGLNPGRWAVMSVRDDGPGMAPDVLRRAFEPFFTTKAVGEGSGLGLAMVWGTMESHGGTVIITSEPGQGALVECYLPRIKGAPAVVARGKSSPPQAGRWSVLIVDDEPAVRTTFQRAFKLAGHEVETANDGFEAVSSLQADPNRFDVVVLDMSMPRMNGAECYRRMREIRPELPIVCVSGYALDSETQALLGGDVIFVPKPAAMRELFDAVADAMAARASANERPAL